VAEKTILVEGRLSDWPLVGDAVTIEATKRSGGYADCVTPRGRVAVMEPSDSLAPASTGKLDDAGTVTQVTDITSGRGATLGRVVFKCGKQED
jgi:hypothetical protein